MAMCGHIPMHTKANKSAEIGSFSLSLDFIVGVNCERDKLLCTDIRGSRLQLSCFIAIYGGELKYFIVTAARKKDFLAFMKGGRA